MGKTKSEDNYVINEVAAHLRSDNAFQPDAPLRPTQTTIGYFLSKEPLREDEAYGIHKSVYGGVGDFTVFDGKTPVNIPRSHHHVRTGLDSYPQTTFSKRAILNRVKANEGLFAKEVSRIGPELFELSRSFISTPLAASAEKQLFPRSICYESAYTKAVNKKAMLEALEKERENFEKAVQERKAAAAKKTRDERPKRKEEPQKEIPRKEESPGKKEDPRKDLKQEEFYKSEECTSVCGPCGCVLVRGKCPKCLISGEPKIYEVEKEAVGGWKGDSCKKWPNEYPRYGSPWGDQRKAELLRVGYPFAQEAVSWLYCTTKPLDCGNLYKPSKKKFPERAFSSLNI